MTHPGLDVLLAHADGELSVDEEREIAGHAAECAACSASLAELRGTARLFAGTLHVLDGAEPAAWAADTHDLAPRGGREQLPVRREPAPQERSIDAVRPLHSARSARALRYALRWAAGIALVTGAAASAAIIRERAGSDVARPVDVSPPAAVEGGTAAVIATPLAGVLHVALAGAGSGSRLYVTAHDAAEVSVTVEGGDSPRFTAVAGRVDLDLRGSAAEVRVAVPSALREVRVTLDGVPLVISRHGVTDPPHAGTAGVPVDASARLRME